MKILKWKNVQVFNRTNSVRITVLKVNKYSLKLQSTMGNKSITKKTKENDLDYTFHFFQYSYQFKISSRRNAPVHFKIIS